MYDHDEQRKARYLYFYGENKTGILLLKGSQINKAKAGRGICLLEQSDFGSLRITFVFAGDSSEKFLTRITVLRTSQDAFLKIDISHRSAQISPILIPEYREMRIPRRLAPDDSKSHTPVFPVPFVSGS